MIGEKSQVVNPMAQIVECRNCGHIGPSRGRRNPLTLIVLLMFGLFPGIIYLAVTTNGLGRCKNCGNTLLVPYAPGQPMPLMSAGQSLPGRQVHVDRYEQEQASRKKSLALLLKIFMGIFVVLYFYWKLA